MRLTKKTSLVFHLTFPALCSYLGAAPVFSLSSYSGTVDENVLVDTIVNGITLSATVSGGGDVTYSIISSAGPFKLSTNGTKVLTNGLVVNFEAQNSYILTVQAESSGTGIP